MQMQVWRSSKLLRDIRELKVAQGKGYALLISKAQCSGVRVDKRPGPLEPSWWAFYIVMIFGKRLFLMAFILQLSALALILCTLCYLMIQTPSTAKNPLDIAIATHIELTLRHLVPGEAIEAIRKTQKLACYIQHGTWIIQGRNHAHYRHDLNCLENWSSLEELDLPQITSLLCSHISGKRVHLVGPRAFYHAQTLLLQALAFHDNKSYSSRGPESGAHYFVCGGSRNKQQPPSTLPFNPRNASFSSRIPSVESTRLSFSLSDRLQGSQHRMVSQPVVDPRTGIRTYISEWFSKTQKAQILIVNKGPIPAPASTFGSPTGNWSFTKLIPQEVRTGLQDNDLTFQIINAALYAVFQEYLPDLLHAFDALHLTSKPQRIFFGSWYQQPICTNAGLSSGIRTTSLIWERNTSARIRQVDPWTLYYNAQGWHTMILSCHCSPAYGSVYH